MLVRVIQLILADDLICLKCGEVIEFNDDLIEEQQKLIAERYGITLSNHSLFLSSALACCRLGTLSNFNIFKRGEVIFKPAFFKVNVNVELFVVKANIFNKPRRIYTASGKIHTILESCFISPLFSNLDAAHKTLPEDPPSKIIAWIVNRCLWGCIKFFSINQPRNRNNSRGYDIGIF
jgi:hypothetical protein